MKAFIFFLSLLTVFSCSKKKQEIKMNPEEQVRMIQSYLADDFLGDRAYHMIPQAQRRFEYYPVDLNQDGVDELFIKLVSPYFCGSGGCTILLLDSKMKLIQKFTVSDLFTIQPIDKGEWSLIWAFSDGKWRILSHPYPSNPSIEESVNQKPQDDFIFLEGSKIYRF